MAVQGGLTHVGAIINFYLAGGLPTSVWYTGPGSPFVPTTSPQCSYQLVTFLTQALAIISSGSIEDIWALATAVVEFLANAVLSSGASLGACAPDVPAVLLAVTATYCPQSGKIYNPLNVVSATNGDGWTSTSCTPTVSCCTNYFSP